MRIEKGPPNRNKLLRYSEKKGGNVAGLLTSLQQGRRIKKRSCWTLRDAINQTSNNDSIVITIILSPLAFSFSNPAAAAAAAAGSNDLNAMPSVYSSPLASLSSATRTGVRLDDEERDEKI